MAQQLDFETSDYNTSNSVFLREVANALYNGETYQKLDQSHSDRLFKLAKEAEDSSAKLLTGLPERAQALVKALDKIYKSSDGPVVLRVGAFTVRVDLDYTILIPLEDLRHALSSDTPQTGG